MEAARADESRTIAEQVEICEVEAPPFKETRRGELYARKFRELGLPNVRVDEVGNVLGERPGVARRPHLVLAAHLDTMFPRARTSGPPRRARSSAAPASVTTAAGWPSCWR